MAPVLWSRRGPPVTEAFVHDQGKRGDRAGGSRPSPHRGKAGRSGGAPSRGGAEALDGGARPAHVGRGPKSHRDREKKRRARASCRRGRTGGRRRLATRTRRSPPDFGDGP